MDRPLVKREDFVRFAGAEVKLEKRGQGNEQRRYRGELKGIKGNDVVLLMKSEEILIPLVDVQKAKIVITDALIAAAKEGTDQ